jgi:hypothetical protein
MNRAADMEASRLIQCYERLKPFLANPEDRYLVVDTGAQKVHLCRRTDIIESMSVSTSSRGLGSREGSYRTPTGIHRIAEKIGDGAPEGRIFRDRRDTGANWYDGLTEDNLILTRILRLHGLEEGLNKGPHVDSFERYIYLHGTNKEDQVGTPLSHGCICLRNRDIVRLYDLVPEGTIIFIDAAAVIINGFPCSHLHFVGIMGSGMSAIAQFLRWRGVTITGSDRLLSSDDTTVIATHLDNIGCLLFEQNGSGVLPSTDAVCVSTAIEESNPDIAAALQRHIPVLHRSDVLAAIVEAQHTIAVAGTSSSAERPSSVLKRRESSATPFTVHRTYSSSRPTRVTVLSSNTIPRQALFLICPKTTNPSRKSKHSLRLSPASRDGSP